MKIDDVDIVKIQVDIPEESDDIRTVNMMFQKGLRNIGFLFHKIICNVNIQYRSLDDAILAYFVNAVISESTHQLPPVLDEQGVHTAGTISIKITLADIFCFLSNALPPILKPMLQQISTVKEYVDTLNTLLTDDSNPSTQMYNWDLFTKTFGLRIDKLGIDTSKPHPFKTRLKMLYDKYPAFKEELGDFSCFIPLATISINDMVNNTYNHINDHNVIYAFYAESLSGLTDIYHMIDNILYLNLCDFYYDGTCYIVCAIDVGPRVDSRWVRVIYKDILKVI